LTGIIPKNHPLFHRPRPSVQLGGIEFFVSEALDASLINSPSYESFENTIISVRHNNTTRNLVYIYKPPGTNQQLFLSEFVSFLELTASFPPQTIISGDFNIQVDT
jgi:hypothetical protein